MCVEILDFGEHLAKTKREKPVNANNKLKTDTQTLIISIIALSEEERNILANSVRLPHRESPNFTLKKFVKIHCVNFFFIFFFLLPYPNIPH
jgi:hypothetical protein